MSFAIFINLVKNTIYKEYRNKTLIFAIILTLIIILIMRSILALDFFKQEDVLNAQLIISKALMVFYAIITFWNHILAALLGVNTIKSDFEFGVTEQILSFPIKRLEYLLARLFTVWLLVNAYYLFSLIIAALAFQQATGNYYLSSDLILSYLISSINLIVVITLAVLFSLILNKIQAFILVLIVNFIIGYTNYQFHNTSFEEMFSSVGFMKATGIIIYFLFPHSGTVEKYAKDTLFDNATEFNHIFEWGHYTLTFAILLFITYWLFRRKESFT